MPRFRLRQVLLYIIQHERQSSIGLEVGSWDSKRFPLKTGFSYAQVPFKTRFTVYNSI